VLSAGSSTLLGECKGIERTEKLEPLLAVCAITSLPWLAGMADNEALLFRVSFWYLPGMFVGILVGHGGMHDTSWPGSVG